jgi:PAS domain S-box-containing protein
MKLLLVFNKFCRALGAPIFRFKVVGAAHHSQLQTACKNDALLVEAERLASLGSWEHNLVTGEEVWSANLCQMLGVDPTRTIVSEDLFWKLLHPGDLEAVRCKIEWAMKDRQPFEYRARFILPDGRERVIFARGKLIVDSQNHIVKRIGVTQDITLRVESQKALRESEARFETLFGSIDEIVSEIDSEGKYVNVWCRDESLLPCPKEQILGSTISELFGEEFFAPVEVVVRQVLETGKGENFEYSTVVHGTTHWFLGRMTPIPSADGTKRTLCFLARDITERKRTEASLRRLSASLIDAQDQERRRIAGELHENTAQGLAGMRMLLGGD